METSIFMVSENKTAAARMLEKLKSRQVEIVDVEPEKGYVYQFRQPETLSIILDGGMPEAAASEAVEAWAGEGVGAMPESEQFDEDEQKADRLRLQRDSIIEHSHSPKIVIGKPDVNNDEISVAQIPTAHWQYFLKWIQAGGSLPVMLRMFPEQPAQSVDTRSDAKGKRNRRARAAKT